MHQRGCHAPLWQPAWAPRQDSNLLGALEILALVETAELAHEVAIGHTRAKLGNAAEQVLISLRVTTAFRREVGEWKIVHRHADPITEPRSIQSVARPA